MADPEKKAFEALSEATDSVIGDLDHEPEWMIFEKLGDTGSKKVTFMKKVWNARRSITPRFIVLEDEPNHWRLLETVREKLLRDDPKAAQRAFNEALHTATSALGRSKRKYPNPDGRPTDSHERQGQWFAQYLMTSFAPPLSVSRIARKEGGILVYSDGHNTTLRSDLSQFIDNLRFMLGQMAEPSDRPTVVESGGALHEFAGRYRTSFWRIAPFATALNATDMLPKNTPHFVISCTAKIETATNRCYDFFLEIGPA